MRGQWRCVVQTVDQPLVELGWVHCRFHLPTIAQQQRWKKRGQLPAIARRGPDERGERTIDGYSISTRTGSGPEHQLEELQVAPEVLVCVLDRHLQAIRP